ncbi:MULTISPECIES: hypothetical protein [Saccharothrix]|uniref:hypothetical protein n=1 Tax=Saccharothrix TaxID=2071 RepID=UPI00116154EF|nr:hypothetical protein [Saccharothrix sp. CB00851]
MRSVTAALAGAAVALGLVVAVAAPANAAVPDGYYLQPFDPTVWRVDDGVARAISPEEWAAAGFPRPAPSPTDYVQYPWSWTIYAVTFWDDAEATWDWDRLDASQWRASGSPVPRPTGWIAGSWLYRFSTAPDENFVEAPDRSVHKLTHDEWAATGFRTPGSRYDEGFLKLSWAPNVMWMTGLSTGVGRSITYDDWQRQAFPTPRVVQRVVNDRFYKSATSPVIYYQGPAFHRAITAEEWVGAGRPAPEIRTP